MDKTSSNSISFYSFLVIVVLSSGRELYLM